LHHVVVERWSRGTSLLHTRDARVKLILLGIFLVVLATTPRMTPWAAIGYSVPLLVAIFLGRLPAGGVLLRAAAVLPFSATFSLITALGGEPARAVSLVVKSYLSAAAVLVAIGTTPLHDLLRALESLGAPRFLMLVVQFLYRYLFVISEQAQHMRMAARCRGSARGLGRDGLGFRAAAGAVAVLFARSYARAQGIHRAMLARGFVGHTELLAARRAGPADLILLVLGGAALVAVRLLLGGIA
jgi:cobalt/nickel transport system permease protein